MATRASLDMLVKVTDAASSKLNNIEKNLNKTGKAVQKVSFDLIQFNRIMFSATAFVGLFEKAFTSLSGVMLKGAELGRVEEQFEAVVGPKGTLFQAISNLTDNSIDKIEAMRSGLSLKSLGIVSSMDEVADIVARAGTAAKKAGLDSAEGIKSFTKFLKDGSISNLEFLNLIASTNPALQAQLAILQKTGGAMGTVITTQQKLALGRALLKAATDGNLKGNRDLYDTLFDLGQGFNFLKLEVGKFIGTALQPLLEIATKTFNKFTSTLEDIRDNKKEILFLAKSFAVVTASVLAFAAGLGAVKYGIKALGFLGIGIPGLNLAIIALSGLFLGVTKSADGFINKLELFGKFFKGIYELVSNFNTETGISKITEDLKKLLEETGLYGFVKTISKAIILTKEFASGAKDFLVSTFTSVDNILGSIVNKITKFLGFTGKPWSSQWLKDARGLGKIFAMLGLGFLGSKAIGKMFGKGGAGSGPSGKASDPIYVKNVGLGIGPGAVGNLIPESGGLLATLANLAPSIGSAIGVIGKWTIWLAVGGTAIAGFVSGILNTWEHWKEFGNSIVNALGSMWDYADHLLGLNDLVGTIWEGLKTTVSFIFVEGPKMLFNLIFDSFQKLASVLGFGAGKLAVQINESLGKMNANLANQLNSENSGLSNAQRFGLPAGAPSMLDSQAQDSAAIGLNTQNRVAFVPNVPNYEAERQNLLKATIGRLKGADQMDMQQAFSQAYSDKYISKEEFEQIYLSAINKSKVAEHTEKTSKNTKPGMKTAESKRGC